MRTRRLRDKIILKVNCYTTIAKPLNGSLPRSNGSNFLKLFPINYEYKDKGKTKEGSAILYHLKGIRGAVRHVLSQILREYKLEICHTTDKTETRDGRNILPDGFHPLGSCNNTCLISQIFGLKSQEGLVSFFSLPIGYAKQNSADQSEFQRVHIATENRLNKTHDGISVQDFKETYFSGYFSFEIDVTDLNEIQRGLLYQAVMELERLGRGYNSGYGHIDVQSLQIVKRSIHKYPEITDNTISIKSQTIEEALNNEIFQCLNNFEEYVAKV
ncbi:MAG: hypothetical protein ACW99Q_28205 [Candidatus Kariarchaeaceae archaeon]